MTIAGMLLVQPSESFAGQSLLQLVSENCYPRDWYCEEISFGL